MLEQVKAAFSRKRYWEARPGVPNSVKPSELIQRILSLRNLETNVKHGIEYAEQLKYIPKQLQSEYATFVLDEVKHQVQLDLLASHYGGVENNEAFGKRYQELIIKYDPLVLNFMLEQVFIVTLPLLQKEGDVFANYCASWILLDEAVHILFGRYYIASNNITIPDELIEFAIKAIDYVAGEDQLLRKRLRTVFLKNLRNGSFDSNDVDYQAVIPPRISFFEQQKVVY